MCFKFVAIDITYGNDNVIDLNLFSAKTAGNGLDLFFTKNLFSQSITRAKRLACEEFRRILIKTGILQTRDFILPQAYLEMVDVICRLTWFCLYRESALELGVTDMTKGKLFGLTGSLKIPARIQELFVGVLSPVVIGRTVLCPDESLVRCVEYVGLEHGPLIFGTVVGGIFPLARRYGIPLRLGVFDRIAQFPGAMVSVSEFDESLVLVVNRVIQFKSLTDREVEDLQKSDNAPYPVVMANPTPMDKVQFEVPDADGYTVPAITNTMEKLLDERFDVCHSDLTHDKWFVPFTYAILANEMDLGKLLGSYLHLVWKTMGNINTRRITARCCLNDVEIDRSYLPFRGNHSASPNGVSMYTSLVQLRLSEGKVALPYESDAHVRGHIMVVLDAVWNDLEFPSLDSPFTFVQVDWPLLKDSPFLPNTFKLTRYIRTALKQKNANQSKRNKAKVQGNVHQATIDGKLSVPETEIKK